MKNASKLILVCLLAQSMLPLSADAQSKIPIASVEVIKEEIKKLKGGYLTDVLQNWLASPAAEANLDLVRGLINQSDPNITRIVTRKLLQNNPDIFKRNKDLVDLIIDKTPGPDFEGPTEATRSLGKWTNDLELVQKVAKTNNPLLITEWLATPEAMDHLGIVKDLLNKNNKNIVGIVGSKLFDKHPDYFEKYPESLTTLINNSDNVDIKRTIEYLEKHPEWINDRNLVKAALGVGNREINFEWVKSPGPLKDPATLVDLVNKTSDRRLVESLTYALVTNHPDIVSNNKELLLSLIEKTRGSANLLIMKNLPEFYKDINLLKAMIKSPQGTDLVELINRVYSQPGSSAAAEIAKELLKLNRRDIEEALAKNLLNNEEWKKSNPEILKDIEARKVFAAGNIVDVVRSKPAVKDRAAFIAGVVARVDRTTGPELVRTVLALPEYADQADLLLPLAKKQYPDINFALMNLMYQTPVKNEFDIFRAILDSGMINRETYTFLVNHRPEMLDKLKKSGYAKVLAEEAIKSAENAKLLARPVVSTPRKPAAVPEFKTASEVYEYLKESRFSKLPIPNNILDIYFSLKPTTEEILEDYRLVGQINGPVIKDPIFKKMAAEYVKSFPETAQTEIIKSYGAYGDINKQLSFINRAYKMNPTLTKDLGLAFKYVNYDWHKKSLPGAYYDVMENLLGTAKTFEDYNRILPKDQRELKLYSHDKIAKAVERTIGVLPKEEVTAKNLLEIMHYSMYKNPTILLGATRNAGDVITLLREITPEHADKVNGKLAPNLFSMVDAKKFSTMYLDHFLSLNPTPDQFFDYINVMEEGNRIDMKKAIVERMLDGRIKRDLIEELIKPMFSFPLTEKEKIKLMKTLIKTAKTAQELENAVITSEKIIKAYGAEGEYIDSGDGLRKEVAEAAKKQSSSLKLSPDEASKIESTVKTAKIAVICNVSGDKAVLQLIRQLGLRR